MMIRWERIVPGLLAGGLAAAAWAGGTQGLELESAGSAGRVLSQARALAEEAPSVPGVQAAGDAPLLSAGTWQSLPSPDPQTLAWLASAAPGLDVQNVRELPFATGDAVLSEAVSRGYTYLDLLTRDPLRRSEAYYVSQGVLERLGQKFATGTLATAGRTTKGRAFRMKAFVAGQGRLEFLYDSEDFEFEEGGQTFKVGKGGRVWAGIQGPGDVTISGLSVHAFLWAWADFQRMTKISRDKVRVETNLGGAESPISPIRLK